MRDASALHCSHSAMHLRSLDELKRQFMSGKIDVMRKDWLLVYGVNVQDKIEEEPCEHHAQPCWASNVLQYGNMVWYGVSGGRHVRRAGERRHRLATSMTSNCPHCRR